MNESIIALNEKSLNELLLMLVEANDDEAYIRNAIRNLIIDGEFSYREVINEIIWIFAEKEPDRSLLKLIILMNELSYEGFVHLELFWTVITSNVMFELEDISEIARISSLLSRLGGKELFRAYLAFNVVRAEKAILPKIVMAFYPVGHTIETLQLAEKAVQDQEEDNSDTYI